MTSCGHVTFSNVATIVSAINLVKSVLTHKASGLRFDAAVCKKDVPLRGQAGASPGPSYDLN